MLIMSVSNSMDFVLSLCYLALSPFTAWDREPPEEQLHTREALLHRMPF